VVDVTQSMDLHLISTDTVCVIGGMTSSQNCCSAAVSPSLWRGKW